MISADCGIYLKALGVSIFTIFLVQLLTHHLSHIKRTLIDFLHKALIMQLFFQCFIALLRGNHALFKHIVQNIRMTDFGTLRIHNRIVCRRRFRQTSQHSCLGQRQIFHTFIEIDLRCRSKTIGTLTQIDLVEIQFQNLIFTQRLFNLISQQCFIEFTGKGTFTTQIEVFGNLLSNGTGTGLNAACY